ncbi:putative ribonuclease H-like domain-containing protein [Tanacetum coccineum]|uniref:Ribonuclease H-like domain-containing protein n=1 Tax=Tanacetum coccineum TaxID=301880 RepID=A0ABQ5FDZ4_9ASTR
MRVCCTIILSAQNMEKELQDRVEGTLPAEKRLAVFDKNFAAYHEARASIRNDLVCSNFENIKDDLSGLDKAIGAILGHQTIERNQLLNTSDLSVLLSSRRDRKKEEVALSEECEVKTLAFRAERLAWHCFCKYVFKADVNICPPGEIDVAGWRLTYDGSRPRTLLYLDIRQEALQNFFATLFYSASMSFDALLVSLLSTAKSSHQSTGIAKQALFSIAQCVAALCLATEDYNCSSTREEDRLEWQNRLRKLQNIMLGRSSHPSSTYYRGVQENRGTIKTEELYRNSLGTESYIRTLDEPSSEESCPNQNSTSAGAQEQSSPNISATKDTVPNLISEVSNSQPSDSLDEILENIHETVRVQEHEEPTLLEVPEKYVLPARSNRGIPPKRYTPEKTSRSSKYLIANIARGNLSKESKVLFTSLYSEEAPSNVEQALKSEKWKNVIDVEMDALMRNKTWDKCILLQGKKPVGCRWIFTIKYKPDGTIERYKARLVAKGYTQTYGIDYSETFSPVAKIDTIRVLFLITANQGWPLHQFDVKNAFLHGELKKEVYMEAPPGFSQHFKHREVCKLKKSLYGLKQSPRAWFGRFTLAMKKYGYKQSNSDHTLFLSYRGDRVTSLIIYVDDMIITGNDENIAYAVGVGTTDHEVLFKTNGHLNIQIFTDADWAGDKGNRISTSGYLSLVGGNLVTWKSKNQKVISLSSVEAELRGITKGLAEALWIRKLVSKIRFPPKESIRIMSDNKAAIQISKNPVQHDRTKHVEVD